MARLSMAFLGGFCVELGSSSRASFVYNKARALLAYLVCEHDRAHSRESLIDLLWPDYSQEAAQSNLRNTLAGLRDSIGDREADPPFLLISRSSVQFNRGAGAQADVWAFLNDAIDLHTAIKAYCGPFLHGFALPDSIPYEDWLSRKRAALAERAQERLAAFSDQAEACGNHAESLAWTRRCLELEPWREEAHYQAMRALALLGQRAAALTCTKSVWTRWLTN